MFIMFIICLCLIWLMMLHIISHHGNVNLILRYHYILVRVGKIRITDNTKFWWGCELSYMAGGRLPKWYSHFRRQFGVSLQNLTPILTIQFSNLAPWYLPNWVENISWPHKKLHRDVYSSFIYNCQNLEATKDVLQ